MIRKRKWKTALAAVVVLAALPLLLWLPAAWPEPGGFRPDDLRAAEIAYHSDLNVISIEAYCGNIDCMEIYARYLETHGRGKNAGLWRRYEKFCPYPLRRVRRAE